MPDIFEPLCGLDVVVLRSRLPISGLPAGQTGTVVFIYADVEAVEVEFILEPRQSLVLTVPATQLLKLLGIPPAIAQ